MTELVRVQVLLSNRQKRALQIIAKKEKRSVSDVLREVVERGLEQRKDQQAGWKDALERLNKRREANAPRGAYKGNPVAKVRAERDQQLEEIWRKS